MIHYFFFTFSSFDLPGLRSLPYGSLIFGHLFKTHDYFIALCRPTLTSHVGHRCCRELRKLFSNYLLYIFAGTYPY